MTNSKWLSALLAGTALTVASSAAFADTSMLTLTRNAAGEGVTFKISPTADMPAAATEVTIAGEIRAILSSSKPLNVTTAATADIAEGDRVNDLGTRARVFVRGKTETAVGLVGANFRIEDKNGANAVINQYTGYWEFSPGLTLTAGRTDSIASIVYGADWNATGGTYLGTGTGLTNSSFEQVNVAFTSGPVALTVGLEESVFGDEDLAVAGSAVFSAGDFGAQLAGKSAKSNAASIAAGDNAYAIGGGLGYSAGAFGVSVGAVMGTGLAGEYSYAAIGPDVSDDKFNAMSILGTFNMTETTSVEAWYGTTTIEDFAAGAVDLKVSGYGAGVFWNPVSQLRLGASVDTATTDNGTVEVDSTQVGVGAWFKF